MTGIALFVAVYVPAFTITALVQAPIETAIPLIIAITLLVALFLMFMLARSPTGMAEFGFCIPHSRYVAGKRDCSSGLLSGSPSLFSVIYSRPKPRLMSRALPLG